MPTPPLVLVPHSASHDLIAVLRLLQQSASRGELTGLVFGATMKGSRIYCDAAGTLYRNAIQGIGVATILCAEMEQRLRHEAIETVFPPT